MQTEVPLSVSSPAATALERMKKVAERGGQIGRATSLGWSPILKQAIALASVPPSHGPLAYGC